jgi:hypothetical protein
MLAGNKMSGTSRNESEECDVPEFRTRPDGTRYPITPKGKAAGTVVAGAVIAGLMTAASGGTGTESVGAALDSASEQNAKSSSQDNARKSDRAKTWQRKALREVRDTVKQDLRCAVQSYGQVQQFFLQSPCDTLDQMLFALSDAQGNIIAVSVMWVKMPSADEAGQLKKLEDTYGTGDVTPFATEALQLGGIKFTGRHYASRANGSLVVIAESEAVQGNTSTTLLDDVAKIAVVLPRPAASR